MDLTSNEPFWLVKNGLLNSFPSVKSDIKTEILIVGGGITGALMAHKCIEEGYETTLVDRREVANGSTSATTSMLQYEIDVPLHELSEMIGNYVLFIVWANFISSLLYLTAAIGFIKHKKWTTIVLAVSSTILIIAFVFLKIHIANGGVFETKTVGAMKFRTALTLVFTLMAYFTIQAPPKAIK